MNHKKIQQEKERSIRDLERMCEESELLFWRKEFMQEIFYQIHKDNMPAFNEVSASYKNIVAEYKILVQGAYDIKC